MTNAAYLTVVKVESATNDKNGRPFKKISVKSNKSITTVTSQGEEIMIPLPSKETTIIAYENNYLDKQDFGWDFQPNQYVAGDIVTRKVTPYDILDENGEYKRNKKGEITGKDLTVASVVVFGDSSDEEAWEIEVEKAFKAKQHSFPTTAIIPNPTVIPSFSRPTPALV